MTSLIPPIYLRREPTTDSLLLRELAPSQLAKRPRDVVVYRDRAATQFAGRFPWHYTKPDRRNRSIMLNCTRRRVVWLADLQVKV